MIFVKLNNIKMILRHQVCYPTLLVEGLEYDHAVVLDADSIDAEHLYGAMPRGSKSLSIIGDR